MDKASSYKSKSTTAYLAKEELKTGIKCITLNDTLVKPLDVSPMNFCTFDSLKQALGKRHPRTLSGVWKTI